MTRTLRIGGQLVALAAVVGLLALLVWHITHQTHAPKVGAAAPSFTLHRLGSTQKLALAAFRGKPVVLNFWASWCVPCKSEAPVLEQEWTRYRSRVQFVGIDYHDVTSDAEHFVAAHRLTFPMVQDGSGDVTQGSYGITQVPETYVVNGAGRVVLHIAGPITGSTFPAELQRVLASKG